jgi:hypothetical protein
MEILTVFKCITEELQGYKISVARDNQYLVTVGGKYEIFRRLHHPITEEEKEKIYNLK